MTEVSAAMGLDPRIGGQFLDAGMGWGGSCFGKDVHALVATAQRYGYRPRILEAALAVNRDQRVLVVDELLGHLKLLAGARLAVLGLAFKPGTDDLRDSPAVEICERLVDNGSVVTAYDPMVPESAGPARVRRAPGHRGGRVCRRHLGGHRMAAVLVPRPGQVARTDEGAPLRRRAEHVRPRPSAGRRVRVRGRWPPLVGGRPALERIARLGRPDQVDGELGNMQLANPSTNGSSAGTATGLLTDHPVVPVGEPSVNGGPRAGPPRGRLLPWPEAQDGHGGGGRLGGGRCARRRGRRGRQGTGRRAPGGRRRRRPGGHRLPARRGRVGRNPAPEHLQREPRGRRRQRPYHRHPGVRGARDPRARRVAPDRIVARPVQGKCRPAPTDSPAGRVGVLF